MLDFMRRNAGSWFVKIALAIISLTFIFFLGQGGQIGPGQQAVATVGDHEISLREFQQTRIRNDAYFRNTYGDQLTPELLAALDVPGTTLNQLVEGALLRQEADNLGIQVPDDAVRSVIEQMDAFQRNGSFSPGIYRIALQRQGYTPAGFEASIRNEILTGQMRDIVGMGARVTEEETFNEFVRSEQKVKLAYIKVPGEDYRDQVQIEEEALATFFSENGQDYEIPDSVSIEYIAYTPDGNFEVAEPSREQIEEYYALHEPDEFTRAESVAARHILKRVDAEAPDEDKAAARTALEAAKARLEAGESFADLASEVSDDATAKTGGDLGSFGRGAMVKPFEEAAFALEPGGRSDIVETRFGFHLIEVYERQAGGTVPLDEVEEKIIKKLKDRERKTASLEAAIDDGAALLDGASFDKVAADRGIDIEITPLLKLGDEVPGIGKAPSFIAAAVELEKEGDVSEPVRVGDGNYILRLKTHKAAHIPDLATVREDVERDFRKAGAASAARAKADALLAGVRDGKTLEEVAKTAGLETKTTEPFSKRGGFIPGLGAIPGLKDVAFSVKNAGEPLPRTFESRGDAYVLVLEERVSADRDKFDERRDELLDAANKQTANRAYAQFIGKLRSSAQVSYNPELIASQR